jgi:hypothetical protein
MQQTFYVYFLIHIANQVPPFLFLPLGSRTVGQTTQIDKHYTSGANACAKVGPLGAKIKAIKHNRNKDARNEQINLLHTTGF